MPWTDAFAPIEAVYREAVLQNAWGHLAPVKNRRYVGSMFFVAGIWGDEELNPVTLRCEFVNRDIGSHKGAGELQGSPWFYEFLQDWYFAQIKAGLIQTGIVYEFRGYFRNYEFVGKMRPLYDFTGANPKYVAPLD